MSGNKQQRSGREITEEQVSDTLTEGTIDGRIDQVDKEGQLLSHKGKRLNTEANIRKK